MKSRILATRAVPIGTIQPYGGDSAPENYIICDGAVLSRTEYPDLFSIIDTFWGQGDGSTTFHIPDLRGTFLRGEDKDGNGIASGRDIDRSYRVASNAGGNTGNNVGSFQGKGRENHNHGSGDHTHLHTARDHRGNGYIPNRVGSEIAPGDSTGWRYLDNAEVYNFDTQYAYSGVTSAQGGADTRSENANVRYIIKIK